LEVLQSYAINNRN